MEHLFGVCFDFGAERIHVVGVTNLKMRWLRAQVFVVSHEHPSSDWDSGFGSKRRML